MEIIYRRLGLVCVKNEKEYTQIHMFTNTPTVGNHCHIISYVDMRISFLMLI